MLPIIYYVIISISFFLIWIRVDCEMMPYNFGLGSALCTLILLWMALAVLHPVIINLGLTLTIVPQKWSRKVF